MCCKNVWKKVVPFTLALVIGLSASNITRKIYFDDKQRENIKPVIEQSHFGAGEGNGIGTGEYKRQTAAEAPAIDGAADKTSTGAFSPEKTGKIELLAKPAATYTDTARQNNTEGTVSLRVEFLANGQIGDVLPVNSLPDGLTETAIAAAKRIRFKPAVKNGQPVTVTKQIQYKFSIY